MVSNPDDEKQTEEAQVGAGSEDRVEAKIDRDLRDSFPASDPPGWVLGVKRSGAESEEEDADDSAPGVEGDAA